jgi:hypothetical protein
MKKLKLSLLLGLMVIMMFLITMIPSKAAIIPYNVVLPGVEINYVDGANGNIAFYQRTTYGYDNGFIYFGYPNYQDIGVGGNLVDGEWTFSSSNINYRYMYIGYYEFDIYTYDYYIEVSTRVDGDIDIFILSTDDPRYQLDLLISDTTADNSTWTLKDDSQDSVTQAFQSGYEEGQSDYGYLVNGVWVTANDWGNDRYQDGLAQGPQDALAIRNMIPGILGVMIAFFFQIASISVLGISILDILALTLGITVTIFLLRVFLNR